MSTESSVCDRFIDHYMIHDPIGNVENMLTVFDTEQLAEAESHGIVFIAVYDDGSRVRVAAEDIAEPVPHACGVTLCTPTYVDDRTNATVAVFDALVAIVDPESTVATADETGEEVETAADPVETFKAALTALKALEPKKEVEVD